MNKKTLFLLLILLPFFSNCTQDFSFQYHFKLKDELGHPISDADIYLASFPMYPLLPWWWDYWVSTVDIQEKFKSSSNHDGTVTVAVPKHRTCFSEKDFFLVVHKEGYFTAIVPFVALRPSVILYKNDSESIANNHFFLIKGDVLRDDIIYCKRVQDCSQPEYRRILLYKPIPSRLSKIIQRCELEL